MDDAVRGDLLRVRTTFDDHETVWPIDLARGVTRALQRTGTFRVTLALSALSP